MKEIETNLERVVAEIPASLKTKVQIKLLKQKKQMRTLVIELFEQWLAEQDSELLDRWLTDQDQVGSSGKTE